MLARVECVSINECVLLLGVSKAFSANCPVFRVINENNVPQITKNPFILNKYGRFWIFLNWAISKIAYTVNKASGK